MFYEIIEEFGFVLRVDVLSEVLDRCLFELSVLICAHFALQCLLELVTHDGQADDRIEKLDISTSLINLGL